MRVKISDSIIGLYKKIHNMRIAWKITCAYFIILALPIIGTGIFINYTTTKSFIYQSELLARQSLLQKREIINQKIESIEKTSISIAQNPQIKSNRKISFSRGGNPLKARMPRKG